MDVNFYIVSALEFGFQRAVFFQYRKIVFSSCYETSLLADFVMAEGS